MSVPARQVHCDDCHCEQFKVLIFGTGTSMADYVLVCDFCNTRVNLLNVDTFSVHVDEAF